MIVIFKAFWPYSTTNFRTTLFQKGPLTVTQWGKNHEEHEQPNKKSNNPPQNTESQYKCADNCYITEVSHAKQPLPVLMERKHQRERNDKRTKQKYAKTTFRRTATK